MKTPDVDKLYETNVGLPFTRLSLGVTLFPWSRYPTSNLASYYYYYYYYYIPRNLKKQTRKLLPIDEDPVFEIKRKINSNNKKKQQQQ
jgi:hypothetical protein